MRVGFIGVGRMGSPMARNLVAAGHEVAVYDLVSELVEECAAAGAVSAESARAAVSGAEVVVTMLPASEDVRGLYLEGGLIDAIDSTATVVDCSTIAPEMARLVAERARESGLDMLDAPVSGGTTGAERGTLTFMVGGEKAVLDGVRPLLEQMGSNVFYAGGSGAGQMAKVCNNMLLGSLMVATAEALALGAAGGLDPARLSAIMQRSSGGNWSLNQYNPWPGVMEGVPASRGYEGGFVVDLMIKDLELALEAAAVGGVPVAMGSLARNLYRMHRHANDAGALDFSSIQLLIEPGAAVHPRGAAPAV